MDTVIIKPQNKSDVQFLLDFAKRIGASAKAFDTEELEDKVLLSLLEDEYNSEQENISRDEVMKILDA
jgi:hypothetical protein